MQDSIYLDRIPFGTIDIIDYRQFNPSDERYSYYKNRELELLRNNERYLRVPYNRIVVYGKNIVDYRQFHSYQYQYRCYMEIENEIIETNKKQVSIDLPLFELSEISSDENNNSSSITTYFKSIVNRFIQYIY
jgi:hypothetical protein